MQSLRLLSSSTPCFSIASRRSFSSFISTWRLSMEMLSSVCTCGATDETEVKYDISVGMNFLQGKFTGYSWWLNSVMMAELSTVEDEDTESNHLHFSFFFVSICILNYEQVNNSKCSWVILFGSDSLNPVSIPSSWWVGSHVLGPGVVLKGGSEKSLTWVMQTFDQKGFLCRLATNGEKIGDDLTMSNLLNWL